MEVIFRNMRALFFLISVISLTLIFPSTAKAVGIDFLGEATKPIIGPAQDKLKKAMVYIWLQPYVGYGSGSSDQSRTHTGGSTVTRASDLDASGFLWGGRGGLLLMRSLKVGLDYSVQSVKRDTLLETTTGTYLQQPVKGRNTLLGATVGLDIPYTPLLGHYTHYFKASISGDAASSGDGWGAGVSFVIKNPFILSLESRALDYSSAADLTGKKAEGSVKQYYVTLSFMLL